MPDMSLRNCLLVTHLLGNLSPENYDQLQFAVTTNNVFELKLSISSIISQYLNR